MTQFTHPVTREQVLEALRAALEPLDYVHAMWEGGAIAFGRLDEWSDIDVQFEVDDERIADGFAAVERALQTVSPIALQQRMPDTPAYAQTFYRLRDASPYMLVDVALMRRSGSDKLLEPEIHGAAVFHFDKGLPPRPQPLDWDALQARLRDRLAVLRTTFEMFQVFTLKELNRGNPLDALIFYQAFTLRPLVEALRIRYQPARHGFYVRYAAYDLPADVVQRLEGLFFVTGVEDIRARRAEAEAWFDETIAQILHVQSVRSAPTIR